MEHYLKIWPEHWRRIFEGTKIFEIRNNDRFFQRGDTVVLQAFDPDSGSYGTLSSMPALHRKIGDVYPIDAERVVFSLLPEDAPCVK